MSIYFIDWVVGILVIVIGIFKTVNLDVRDKRGAAMGLVDLPAGT